MITVVKCSPQGKAVISYKAEVIARSEQRVIVRAHWESSRKDLGYTVFEPGDTFIEYFYSDQWFNIFAISGVEGQRKGWYCNIAMPARLGVERIEQIDLLLDVWVDAQGKLAVLDEDEFVADTSLTENQQSGARQGLQDLLALIASRYEPFQELAQGVPG